jgi:hypothetical protein
MNCIAHFENETGFRRGEKMMKTKLSALIALILFFAPACYGGFLDDLLKGLMSSSEQGILNGADSAATDYFRSKTSDRIYNEFKPCLIKHGVRWGHELL